MKNKFLSAVLCFSFLIVSLCSCGKNQNTESEQSIVSSAVMEEGTFDIEAIRTNINIKGHKFTVPQKLSELEEGLTYEFVDEEFDDGLYMVEIFDEKGLILKSIATNAHKKSKKAFLYNVSVEDSDSDVAGIVPLVSTKEDVLKQFGAPDDKVSYDYSGEKKEAYKYGVYEPREDFKSKGQFMTIGFNSSNVVEVITVNYSE